MPAALKRSRIWWRLCRGVSPEPGPTSPSDRPTTLLVGAIDGVAVNQAVKTPVWGSNAVTVKASFMALLHGWPIAAGRGAAAGPSAGDGLPVSAVVPMAASAGFSVTPPPG